MLPDRYAEKIASDLRKYKPDQVDEQLLRSIFGAYDLDISYRQISFNVWVSKRDISGESGWVAGEILKQSCEESFWPLAVYRALVSS